MSEKRGLLDLPYMPCILRDMDISVAPSGVRRSRRPSAVYTFGGWSTGVYLLRLRWYHKEAASVQTYDTAGVALLG